LGVCLDELYVGLGAGASVRIVSVSSSMSCLTCCVCVVLGLMLSTCVNMCCSWGTGGKCCRDNTICALVGKYESVKVRSVGNSDLPHPGVLVICCCCCCCVLVTVGTCGCVGVGGSIDVGDDSMGGVRRAMRMIGLWSSCELANVGARGWMCRVEWSM
jgi:hypothetical protein